MFVDTKRCNTICVNVIYVLCVNKNADTKKILVATKINSYYVNLKGWHEDFRHHDLPLYYVATNWLTQKYIIFFAKKIFKIF